MDSTPEKLCFLSRAQAVAHAASLLPPSHRCCPMEGCLVDWLGLMAYQPL